MRVGARALRIALLAAATGGSRAQALLVILSTRSDATLGTLSFEPEDLVQYDTLTDSATLFLDGDAVFVEEENIDAFHLLPNGNILLSTAGGAQIGTLVFAGGDLVEYDPVANAATLYFDGSAEFTLAPENIDALHLLANGHLLLSTVSDATLGTLAFEAEDLVEYDMVAHTATLFFDGDAEFPQEEDIDAVDVLANGHLVLSTADDATLGSLTFEEEDLVEYDPVGNTATLLFDGDAEFTLAEEDIDAVQVIPEPGPAALLTSGLMALGRWRRPGTRTRAA